MTRRYLAVETLDQQTVAELSSARIPDRSGRLIVHALAPHHVGILVVVDGDSEVVSEGEVETFLADIAIAGDIARELRLIRPGRAAVIGTTVVGVPLLSAAGIQDRKSVV